MELWISNETGNTTLKYHKYETKLHSPPKLKSELLAGDPTRYKIPHELPETEHLVVYEANSFTLAIFIHWNDSKTPKSLQLELSLDKVHLGKQDCLNATFSRMSKMLDPPDAATTAVTRCQLHGKGKVSTWLFAGPYKLMATLHCHVDIQILEVQLEEREMN